MKRNFWLALVGAVALAGPAAADDAATGGSEYEEGIGAPSGAKESDKATGEKSTQGSQEMGSTFAANQIVGEIKSLDKTSKEVTIDHAGTSQELKLSESATVFIDGRLGSFEDLQEGQQVRAAFEEKAGEKNVRWIEVTPAGTQPSTPSEQGATGEQSSTGEFEAGEEQRTGYGTETQPSTEPSTTEPSMPSDDTSIGAPTTQPGTTQPGTTGGTMQHGTMQHGAMMGQQMQTQVVGTVVSVNKTRKQVVLENQGVQWTLEIKRDAQVMIEGQRGDISSLKEGQQVRASLEPATTGGQATLRIETIPAGSMGTQGTQGTQPQQRPGGTTGGY